MLVLRMSLPLVLVLNRFHQPLHQLHPLKIRLPHLAAQRTPHVESRRVTEEQSCFILQDIEMIAVVESHRRNSIHPKSLFLMEMRAPRPIDFVIRIARLEYAVFSSVIFVAYHFEHCNQPSGRVWWSEDWRSICRLALPPAGSNPST